MRRHSFYASGFSWYELQNQTWRGRRFWTVIPLCREYTLFLESNPNPELLEQFLEEKKLDQSLKFRSWKFLTKMDLKLQFHHLMKENGHPMLWFPERRVGSWMKFIFPKPNSDQVQNYSLNFKNLMEENLVWHSRRLAFRKLVQPMFKKVQLATRKPVRTPSALLQPSVFVHTKNHSYDQEELESYACQIFVWRSSVNSGFEMVTRMVRHYDQDERQSDAALHWDAIRPVLLKAFAEHGARDFSDQQWRRLIHEGSSKTRFEFCEDSQHSLDFFRALQGHSGGIPTDPELMGYVLIPHNWKEYIYHRGCSFSIQSILESGLILGGKESHKGRQTIFFTPLNPFGWRSWRRRTPWWLHRFSKSVTPQSLET